MEAQSRSKSTGVEVSCVAIKRLLNMVPMAAAKFENSLERIAAGIVKSDL